MPLIWALIAISAFLLLAGLRRPECVFQFPFLASATFLGFIAPQLPALVDDPSLSAGAVAQTTLFAILCVSACGLGWQVTLPIATNAPQLFDEKKLLIISAVLSLFGGYFYWQVSNLPPEIKYSVYTGLPVAYLFFARLLVYGFAIALLCCARRMSVSALAIIAFGTWFYAERILVLGRRSEAAEFVFLIALAWWFQKRRTAPRLLTAGFVLFGAIALNSTGEYRSITTEQQDSGWSDVLKIDVIANFYEILAHGGPEVRNAVLRISTVQETQAFDVGLFHWNTLVFNYVPAQLVGKTIKDSLTIPIEDQVGRDYDPPYGTTETGLSDAFASFSYFGAFKFFLLGFWMRRLYDSAEAGNTVCQLLYPLMLAPAMQAFSHHTQWPISAFVHMALFLLPALWLARIRHSPLGGYRIPGLPS